MKRFICLLSVLFVVSGVAADAFAQAGEYVRRPHRVTVWLEAGLAIPSQPAEFSDLWNTTWPFSGGVGLSVFSWLEVSGGLTYGSFGISEIPAKSAIGIETTAAIDGGSISILHYFGTARFIAVPSQRVNPYAEVSLGVFKITADDLNVEETTSGPTVTPAFSNSMENVDGINVAFGGGLQYALNDYWTAYSKFLWVMNLNGDFAPKALVARPGGSDVITSDSMQYGIVSVGIMLRI